MTNANTTYTIEQLEAAGGNLWEKGAMRRVYFNNLPALIGLELDKYKSGSIASAKLNGETVSNAEAGRIIEGLGKVWFDMNDGEFHYSVPGYVRSDYRGYGQRAINAIIEKLNG